MNSTFEQHQRMPEVSLEAHVHRTQIELGEAVTGKTLIYLDTKYWIGLQQAAQGTPSVDPPYSTLLELLRKAVTAGKLVCPYQRGHFSRADEAG